MFPIVCKPPERMTKYCELAPMNVLHDQAGVGYFSARRDTDDNVTGNLMACDNGGRHNIGKL